MTKNKNLMTHPAVSEIPKLSEWYHPTLNKYPAESISSRSVVICYWICSEGHTFTRAPNTVRKASKACTECYPYRKVVVGINDLSTTHPEIAKKFSKKNILPVTSYSKGHKKNVLWDCENGHEYEQEVYVAVRPYSGCPVCSGQRFQSGSNDFEAKRPHLKAMWAKGNPEMSSFRISSAYLADWICSEGHEFKARVRSMFKRIDLCHICPKPIPFEDSVAASEKLMKIWSIKNAADPKFLKPQSHSKAIWCFKDCGHEYVGEIKAMYQRDGMCSECSYKTGSSQEEFLANLIVKRYNVAIDQRVRILDGREIDIYIPSLQKGIEFNGERWHRNSKAIEGGYSSALEMHQWKLDKAEEKDIDLVFVWSHDWAKHRKDILAALDHWITQEGEPASPLRRLESLQDGAICSLCPQLNPQ